MDKGFGDLKVAIVADWLTDRGGAERVVLALADIFPAADIFTSVYKAENFPELAIRRVITSYLQGWPMNSRHQLFAWARPQAMESLNLDDYDLVISSSSAEAKGVLTKPETLHICYCHTPTRYYWSHYHEYLADNQFGIFDPLIKAIAPKMIHNLRIWDKAASARPDVMWGNSKYITERIAKYYDREADALYPPVDLTRFATVENSDGDYYLIVGRQAPYKRTDIGVEAFNKLDKPLKIIGVGSDLGRLRSLAKSSKIEFLGRLPDREVAEYIAGCRALLFPQEEDFGIVPLEAMAAGKPVIAYGVGGGTETVIGGKTGILFPEQTVESLTAAIVRFESMTFDPQVCKARAAEFSTDRFKSEVLSRVEELWSQHTAGTLKFK